MAMLSLLAPLGLITGWYLSLVVPPGSQAVPADRIQARVPRQQTVRFVAFGDFGTGADQQYKVAQAIEKKCAVAGCDFAITLGDNIYNDGVRDIHDPQFLSKFEKPYARLPFRFYMVLGNHDYRGNIQAEIDYTRLSKKWTLPARYYAFEEGPVSFFALDTNAPDAQQLSFMQSRLKQSSSPWKIPFGHHPRFTNSFYKNTQTPAQKQLIDSFCGQAQIYLSGHEHDKQHLKPVCGTEYLIMGTAAGNRPYGRDSNTLYANNTFGFAWFQVTEKSLYFQILDSNGKVEYQHLIKKN